MHIHLGGYDFLKFGAYLIIFSYLWRSISLHLADKPIGQAMAFIL